MKRTINILAMAALAAFAAVSCQQEELAPEKTGKPEAAPEAAEVVWTLDAGFVSENTAVAPASRTALDGTKMTWTEGDQIVVNGIESLGLTAADIEEDASKAHFQFTAVPEGDSLVAIYPASAYAGTRTVDVIVGTDTIPSIQPLVTFPAEQSYDPATRQVDPAASILVGRGTGTAVAFKHASAYLKITCDQPVKSIRVMANCRVLTDGNMSAGMAVSGIRSIVRTSPWPTDAVTPDIGTTVTVSNGDNGFAASQAVVIPIPARNYSAGLNFFVITTDGKYQIFRTSDGVDLSEKSGKLAKITLALNDLKDYAGPGIYSADDYQAFVCSYEAQDDAMLDRFRDSDGVYQLYSDFSTVNLSRLGSNRGKHAGTAGTNIPFSGEFNGNGHTIHQSASNVPLFGEVSSSGKVHHLTLSGECTSIGGVNWGTASLAIRNYGTISYCNNQMNFTYTETADSPQKTQIYASGLVTSNAGRIEYCSNSGNITLNLYNSANRYVRVGGIAIENMNSIATDYLCGDFISCTNTGNITITKHSTASAICAQLAVGGICGRVMHGVKGSAGTHAYSTFDTCINEGDITFHEDAHHNVSAGNFPICIGGIVGTGAPYLSNHCIDFSQTAGNYVVIRNNCINRGTLDVSSSNTSPSLNQSGARQIYAGGMIGFIYGVATDATSNANYAVLRGQNYGTIRVGSNTNATNGGNECAGGIAGGAAFTTMEEFTADFKFEETTNNLFNITTAGSCAGLVGMVVKRCVVLGRTNSSNPCLVKMDASGLNGLVVTNTGLSGVTNAKSVDGTGTSSSQYIIYEGARYIKFQGRKPDRSNFAVGTYTERTGCDALYGGASGNSVVRNGANIIVEAYPES